MARDGCFYIFGKVGIDGGGSVFRKQSDALRNGATYRFGGTAHERCRY
jgi:hypothetical protein